jgi:DHA1 family inner membrane transport protein
MSAPLSTSHVASSLPVSAATVRIALGSYPGGVAIGTFAASSAVVTALIIAVISIPVAWAAGFLKPPVIADATELAAATV